MPTRPIEVEVRSADAVTWGGQTKPRLQVVSFKPVSKNTLRGFTSVQFASRLRLLDCLVHVHPNGREWVAVPGKLVLDEDGRHKREINGKPYVPIAEGCHRQIPDRFSQIVLGLLREKYPGALNDGGAP